jgi:hypothetical protein
MTSEKHATGTVSSTTAPAKRLIPISGTSTGRPPGSPSGLATDW